MKPLLLIFALILSPAAWGAETTVEPNLDREIRLMLRLTGSEELGLSMMKNMIVSLKQAMPSVPDDFWVSFEAEIKPGELAELVVPIYARYLTIEEVQAANVFYSSPEGRAMVAKLPVIMNESMAAGQVWGQAIAEKAAEKLRALNYMPKDA